MCCIIQNPLAMNEMAKHTPNARSYDQATILVDGSDIAHFSNDPIINYLSHNGIWKSLVVARDLKVKSFLIKAIT